MSTLLLGAAIAAMYPAPAAAQMNSMVSQCKQKFSLDSLNQQTKRTPKPDDPPDMVQPWVTSGNVTIVCDDAQLFADEVEYYEATHILKARGHVNFIEGTQRITADHLEFDTKTKLGTFYQAQGIMTISGRPDRSGMFAPADADAYFYGEVIEKTGPDTYKFKNGVLTTCVQPTPRWEIEGSRVVLVRDRHALLRNAVFRIKDVPVFYLPWFYYPISKSGRQTGFLMPSYGHDSFRGQTFSEAFFLVLGRSQDATLHYEYASKSGSGYGGQYRYIQAPGSDGNITTSIFNGKDAADPLLQTRRKAIVGTMVQRLPGNWFLRGNVNYTDNVQARQLLQQDLLLSSDSSRSAGANLYGSIGRVGITGEASILDRFTPVDGKLVGSRSGTLPHINVAWPSAPIGKSKIYFNMAGDFSAFVRQDEIGVPEKNRGLFRFDTHPTLRAPIGSLPYLSATATVGLEFTYWSEQLNADNIQLTDPLTRRLADMRLDVRGPVFSKIFDTPGSHYATRWKHVIEPTFSVWRLTAFDGVNKVSKNDGIDYIVGGTTNLTYGLANRLLAKRPSPSGPAQAVEVASISISQTYYSLPLAATADTSIAAQQAPSPFSPVVILVNVQPTTRFNTNATLYYNGKFNQFESATAGAGIVSTALNANLSWSKTFLVAGLTGHDNKDLLYQTLNASAVYRAPDNHLSGRFLWSYDFQNKRRMQQGAVVSYMSQCCGVAVEYQTRYVGSLTPSQQYNRTFNLSFTLAGIGSFSNLLGSFGR